MITLQHSNVHLIQIHAQHRCLIPVIHITAQELIPVKQDIHVILLHIHAHIATHSAVEAPITVKDMDVALIMNVIAVLDILALEMGVEAMDAIVDMAVEIHLTARLTIDATLAQVILVVHHLHVMHHILVQAMDVVEKIAAMVVKPITAALIVVVYFLFAKMNMLALLFLVQITHVILALVVFQKILVLNIVALQIVVQ